MTIRDLSNPQRRLMDVFVDHPDWTNALLAHELGWTTDYVEQVMRGVFQVYRVQSRTGAFAVHSRRHPPTRRRPAPQVESLELIP